MSQDALTCTHIRRRSTFRSIESDLQASCKFDAQVVGQDRAGRATATWSQSAFRMAVLPYREAHLMPLSGS